MEKTLIDLFKILIEYSKKHIIPVAISFIAMIITFAWFDSENDLLLKLGKPLFLLFFFCIYFVIIEFFIWIVTNIIKCYNNKIAKKKADKEKKELEERKMHEAERRREEMEEKNLEALWEFVDSLSQPDYDYLEKFLQTDNKVIEVEETFEFREGLFCSNIVNKTVLKEPSIKPIKIARESTNDIFLPIGNHYEAVPRIIGYKLKTEVFELLKLSKEKYGRISHFNK